MIEIPGYRVIRPLGRGGMATVYLAIQESVQREVALKAMSPTLLADEQFGERFVREARIAAKLRHPHVVQIYDVGRVGDHPYIAMEYLPGGAAIARNGTPREPRFALRVIREIAGALGYAQNKGVVHRDIKPDNILLREDGAAVLTDFGIARASDNSRMTRTGAIIGTPHYMSPEQARGLPLDGRADLYSLGIVFHELLLGRVPYQADDSLAVGIMHITAPLPRLPAELASLQPVLDRLLAKEPEQRFQGGAELAAAIERIERDLASVPRGAERDFDTSHERAEPTLGNIDHLLDEPRHRPARPAEARDDYAPYDTLGRERDAPFDTLGRDRDLRHRGEGRREEPQMPGRDAGFADEFGDRDWRGLAAARAGRDEDSEGSRARQRSSRRPETRPARTRGWLLGTAVLLAMLAGGVWLFQDRLRDLWPQTRMNDLLARADRALLENRLEGAEGARELYGAAAALDPDNLPARQGLQRVGLRLLDSARSALAANDFTAARAALAQARELAVPATDADAVQRELDARETRGVELGALLEQAQRASREGRLDQGDDSAVALYRRALAAEPGNALAAAGLRDTLTALLDRARALVAAGQFEQAAVQIEAVAALDASHLGLPDARAQLAEARSQRENQLAAQLDEADRLAKAGRTTAPAGGSARDLYRAVLQADPANQRAQEGLRRIAQTLLGQAQRRMADFEFEPAAQLLDRAEAVDPKVPGLAAARTRMAELQKRASSIPDPQAPATVARVAQLLAEAKTAAVAGNLLTPPGDSAYDKYRAVRSLDPDNAEARAGLAALPALARERFDQALGANRLATARGTLEALATLAPTDPALREMRRKLARSLLGQAAERLGANELPKAREAFEQARELDPTNPELPAMQARLEQAGG
jgi:serine/threonine-protein kinase PpkA